MPEAAAFRIHQRAGGAFRAGLEPVQFAAPAAGEVLIEVHYSGVNYKDALAGANAAPILRTSPLTGGIDLAGVVIESAAPGLAAGTEVLVNGAGLSETRDGGYAPYAVVPADIVVPVTPPLDMRGAMIIGTAGFTAALALERMQTNGQRPEHGPVVVTGACGGVGGFAVHLLSRLGYETVASTRNPDSSRDYLEKLGAARVTGAVQAPAGTLGAAQWGGAIDNLGGETAAALLATTKPWGNVVSIGLAQSAQLPATVLPFIVRGVSLLGVTSANCPMAWKRRIWTRLATDLLPQCLDHILADTITLNDLPAAFQQILAGKIRGRLLVRCR